MERLNFGDDFVVGEFACRSRRSAKEACSAPSTVLTVACMHEAQSSDLAVLPRYRSLGLKASYSTVALVSPISTMEVYRGMT